MSATPPSDAAPSNSDRLIVRNGGAVRRQDPLELLEPLVRRIEGEYREMPGLRLTRAQAERLWALDRPTCAMILDALIERHFLVCGTDDRYRRASDGAS